MTPNDIADLAIVVSNSGYALKWFNENTTFPHVCISGNQVFPNTYKVYICIWRADAHECEHKLVRHSLLWWCYSLNYPFWDVKFHSSSHKSVKTFGHSFAFDTLPLSGISFIMMFVDRRLCGLFEKSLRHSFFPRHIHCKPYPTGSLHGAHFLESVFSRD